MRAETIRAPQPDRIPTTIPPYLRRAPFSGLADNYSEFFSGGRQSFSNPASELIDPPSAGRVYKSYRSCRGDFPVVILLGQRSRYSANRAIVGEVRRSGERFGCRHAPGVERRH